MANDPNGNENPNCSEHPEFALLPQMIDGEVVRALCLNCQFEGGPNGHGLGGAAGGAL